jgi:hypothetical protein
MKTFISLGDLVSFPGLYRLVRDTENMKIKYLRKLGRTVSEKEYNLGAPYYY